MAQRPYHPTEPPGAATPPRLRVTCEVCGPVRLTPDRLLITRSPAGRVFSFECVCGRHNVAPAGMTVYDILTSLDVEERWIGLPRRTPTDAPPLCHDDLLDLHLALRRDDWFDELRA